MTAQWSGINKIMLWSLSEYVPCIERLSSFRLLPDGWYFGSGRAPSEEVLFGALVVTLAMHSAGATCIEVFPDADGGAMVSGYNANDCIEVFCGNDGSFDFVMETGGEEVLSADGLSFDDVIAKIREHAWAAAISFASSLPSITAEKRGGSLDLHSGIHQEVEYPLSIRPASSPQVRVSALTLPNIIQHKSLVTRRSSGDLNRISYLQVCG